jgi:ubiquinone/menaquinone biosynthesis C-methylase UbiE
MKRKTAVSWCAVCAAAVLTLIMSMACGAQDTQGALVPENANEARLNRIQPPERVLGAIGLEPGKVVGEIGAGRGRYTVQIAVRVGPSGKVYANDIDAGALRYLMQRCTKWGISNVETVLGEETDPRFPEGELDLIFMISTYHHISQPTKLMRNALPALKPEGRLAIVEWVPRSDSSSESTAPEDLIRQMNEAGYMLERIETFLKTNNIYIFRIAEEAN